MSDKGQQGWRKAPAAAREAAVIIGPHNMKASVRINKKHKLLIFFGSFDSRIYSGKSVVLSKPYRLS